MNPPYDNKEFLVCVRCATYNHAPYIVDAMNGFTMQKTDFPYVCIIIDDASTDGEPEVIKNYLQEYFDLQDKAVARNEETDDYILSLAQHKTNRNCFFAVIYLKYNHYSINKTKLPYIKEWENHCKYLALCEGDDYWTNTEKLQLQVDYLKNNSDYVAVATNGYFYNSFDGSRHPFSKQVTKDITLEDLLNSPRSFGTASVLYKRSTIGNDYYSIKYKYDVMTWCYLANKGKFKYLDVVTFTYRKGTQGVTISTDPYAWASKMEGLKRELKDRFPDKYKNDVDNEVRWLYLDAATKYFKRNQFFNKQLFKCINKCFWYIPKATIIQLVKSL